jgi:hypothetical protein
MLTRLGSRLMMVVTAALLMAVVVSAQQPSTRASETPAEAPAIAPEVIAALKKMGGFLRAQKAFTLHADTVVDEVLVDTGQKLQFGSMVDYYVRLPNRLRADVISDRKERQFFYDGEVLTLYAQRVKYYASVPAPPTIRETIELAAQKYELEVPLADLFFWGTDEARLGDIQSAINVGPSTIDGVLCDHYAFRQEGVDWQLWIERGDTPMPRKLVITTTDEETQPQYVAQLTWNLTPQLDDTTFTFNPPEDAHQIVLREADAVPESKP